MEFVSLLKSLCFMFHLKLVAGGCMFVENQRAVIYLLVGDHAMVKDFKSNYPNMNSKFERIVCNCLPRTNHGDAKYAAVIKLIAWHQGTSSTNRMQHWHRIRIHHQLSCPYREKSFKTQLSWAELSNPSEHTFTELHRENNLAELYIILRGSRVNKYSLSERLRYYAVFQTISALVPQKSHSPITRLPSWPHKWHTVVPKQCYKQIEKPNRNLDWAYWDSDPALYCGF